ncbi:MAG: hypothetical protein ABL927_13615, partial [Bdellovibrionales bacterium]
SETLYCNVKLNSALVTEIKVDVAESNEVEYARLENFRFKIKSLSAQKFEITVFDGVTPSRSFASGVLKITQDELSWAVWTRETLIESLCRKIN